MKKILIENAVWLIFVIFFGYIVYQQIHNEQEKLTSSATSYIEVVLPNIIRTWSEKDLLNHASPRLTILLNSNPEYLNQFKKLTKLGVFKKSWIDSGKIYTTTSSAKKETIGNFRVMADYKHARAIITLKLILIDNQWKILTFNVFTPMR